MLATISGEIHRVDTKTITESQIQDNVLNSIDSIKDIMLDGDIMISKGIVSKSAVQKYIFHKEKCNVRDNIVKKLILDAAFKAESAAAGSGDLCLKISSEIIPKMIRLRKSGKDYKEVVEVYEKKFKPIIESISTESLKFKKSDFNTLVDARFNTKIEKAIIKKLIDNFNITSSIFLERSYEEETTITTQGGFIFKIPVSKSFLIQSDEWKEKDVKCIVIDGMIESVGEIHHLLEKASNTKDPYVVFVRSLSEDVRRTISLNLKRGTINLIPIEVGFDENTLNILNDLAVACDIDVISSYKGDLISTSTKKDHKSVDRIHITNAGIAITNSPNRENLESHIKYLKSKRDKCYETKFIYENRIKSLSSGKVILKIGNKLLLKNKDTLENFDHFFREIRSYIRHGTLSYDSIKFSNFSEIEEIFREYKIISPISAYFAISNAISLSSNILSIGKGIVSES